VRAAPALPVCVCLCCAHAGCCLSPCPASAPACRAPPQSELIPPLPPPCLACVCVPACCCPSLPQRAIGLLTRIVLNKEYSNDYLYYGIPSPWYDRTGRAHAACLCLPRSLQRALSRSGSRFPSRALVLCPRPCLTPRTHLACHLRPLPHPPFLPSVRPPPPSQAADAPAAHPHLLPAARPDPRPRAHRPPRRCAAAGHLDHGGRCTRTRTHNAHAHAHAHAHAERASCRANSNRVTRRHTSHALPGCSRDAAHRSAWPSVCRGIP
jgi:hypothetical protein